MSSMADDELTVHEEFAVRPDSRQKMRPARRHSPVAGLLLLHEAMNTTASAERLDRRPPVPPPIAVLVSRFPSVTETFILREIDELERQGQPVRLVPMLRERPPVVHPESAPWISRALYTPFLSRSLMAANLRMLARAPRRYLGLLFRLLIGTCGSPRILLRTLAIFPKSVYLAERLGREGIRHVHAHFATHPTTMALVISELGGLDFSFTAHAHDIFVDRHLLRWKVQRAQFIRSISKFNEDFLTTLYPNESRGKIRVIHMGIQPERYRSGRRDGPALCIAAFKPYKGLTHLIDAFDLLARRGVGLECEIVGAGPMEGELRRRIQERGIDSRIRLAGTRTQDQVARIMQQARFFVLPSIRARDGQMEGIPVALMEAMAAELAVISTRLSGVPELVEDGVTGLLVPPGSAEALADAMERLVRSPEIATAMGRRGREKVIREFDVRDSVRELRGAFGSREVSLGSGRPRPRSGPAVAEEHASAGRNVARHA